MFRERRIPFEQSNNKNHGGYSISISGNGNCIGLDFGNILWFNNDIINNLPLSLEQQEKKRTTATVLNSDGSYIAGYVSDHWEHVTAVRLWDTRSGNLIQEYHWNSEFPYDRPKDGIELYFRDNGKQLVALTSLGEVAIWSTINGNLLRLVGGSSVFSNGMVISHDTNWFISLDINPKWRGRLSYAGFVSSNLRWGDYLYGFKSRDQFHRVRNRKAYDFASVYPIGMTRVGELEPVVFKIWDAYSGAPIKDLELPKVKEGKHYFYNLYLEHFELSQDDQLLACEFDKSILVWNTNSGKILQKLTHSERLKLIGFSQDSRYLICHDISQIHIWDIVQQTWIAKHTVSSQLRSITISKQNRIAATVWNGEHWEIAIIDLDL